MLKFLIPYKPADPTECRRREVTCPCREDMNHSSCFLLAEEHTKEISFNNGKDPHNSSLVLL